MADDATDAQIAALFAAQRGLAEGQRHEIIAQLAERSPSIGRCVRRRPSGLVVPDDLQPSVGTLASPTLKSRSDAAASPSSEPPRGPETPAWVRSEAERQRLRDTLDEAVSVSSEVTTNVTGADLGDARSDSEHEPEGRSPDVRSIGGNPTLTADEISKLCKYEGVFDRLHTDIDLLVLRCPLVGQVFARLLQELAEGLLASGARSGRSQASEAWELAVIEPIMDCAETVRATFAGHRGAAWKPYQQHPVERLGAISGSVEECQQRSHCQQRQRFSSGRPFSQRRAGWAKVPPPRAAIDVAATSVADAGDNLGIAANATSGDTLALAARRCLEELSTKFTGLINVEIERHFGALERRLVACLPHGIDHALTT
mmetsp:Transcript_8177/g.20554  ORF Transcript_8177/g.20554 Transcript_8177/m.20554 type:complete len:372 (-) Transcript_8177:323-1438(-)